MVELIIAGVTAAPQLIDAATKLVDILKRNNELSQEDWDKWVAFSTDQMNNAPQWKQDLPSPQ